MEENKTKKLSYEELENVANQLSVQLNQARNQMGQMSAVLTKLPYLFKLVELEDKFPSDFIAKCTAEIMEIMQPEDTEEDNTEE